MESRRARRLKSRQNRKGAAKRLSRLLGGSRRGIASLALAAVLLASSLGATPPESAEALSVPQGQRVVQAAYGLYGTPYVYNGYWWSGYGIDCSELTMLAYRAAGISLPDDPYMQMQRGYWVSTPRAGDLVFFSEDYSGYPTHVGIATGRGTIVHASTYTGTVTETWIGYIDGYMGAKRI